jgi:hypothetical protein
MNRKDNNSSFESINIPDTNEIDKWRAVKKFETKIALGLSATFFSGVLFSLFGMIMSLAEFTEDALMDQTLLCVILFGIAALSFSLWLFGTRNRIEVDGSSFAYVPIFGQRRSYDFRDIKHISFDRRFVNFVIIVRIKGKLKGFIPKEGAGYFLLRANELGIKVISREQMISIDGQNKCFEVNGEKHSLYDIDVTICDKRILLSFKNKKGKANVGRFKIGRIPGDYILSIVKESGIEIDRVKNWSEYKRKKL